MEQKPKIFASSDRILLYELGTADAINFYRLNADSEVLQYTGDQAFASVEDAHHFLEKYQPYETYGFGRWGIKDRKNQTFVGWCGLKYDPDKDEIDLGFRILKQEWNKGYATEASQLCLVWAFALMKIPKIVGRAHANNSASIHLLEKLGFEYQSSFLVDNQEWLHYELSNEKYKHANS